MRIYYTSDLHGYYFPTDYIDDEIKPMGLLSISKEIKKDANTILIDNGDTLQGSAFAYYRKILNDSKTAADIMNKVGFDYVNLGNHDFNYGYDYLRDYVNRLDAKVICANVVDKRGEINNLRAYDILEIEGKKVGIIGLVTDWINIWEQEKNLVDFEIKDSFESLKEVYPKISDCDFKILVYHGGIEFDIESLETNDDSGENIGGKIAENFDIDLLLTGHQHMEFTDLIYKDTYIIQPSHSGKKYAQIDIDLENKEIKSLLKRPSGDFDREVFEDELLKNQKTVEFLDQSIADLGRDYPAGDKLKTALEGSDLADLINKIQLEKTGADVSVTSFANEISGLSRMVTMREVLNTYRFPNTLVVIEIPVKGLLEMINRNYLYIIKEDGEFKINPEYIYPKLQHYNFDFFYGVDFDVDYEAKDPMERVKSLYKDGRKLGEDERLEMAMNNYRATGVHGFYIYPKCPKVKEINIEISQLIIDYFMDMGK